MNESIAAAESIESLRVEAEFGRAILHRVVDGLCVCHEVDEFPFVRFTVWNEAMVRITGYGIDEINRRGWYQTMYSDPAVQAQAMERMARMRQGDDLTAEEWQITRADGVRRWVQISTTVVLHQNRGTHVMALMQDISERKRAEATREALLFLETDLGDARTPVEAARVVFRVADKLWSWDAGFLNVHSPDGQFYHEVLDVDLVGGVRTEVPLEENPQPMTQQMRKVMDHGGELICRGRAEVDDRDGSQWVSFGDRARRSRSLMFVPIRWHGQPVGILSVQSYLSDAFTDEDLRTLQGLADHCGGALRRIQAVEALQLSEEDLHRAQAVAQTGSWYLDVSRNSMTWSAETSRILGLSPDVPKSPSTFAACIDPGDKELVGKVWDAAVRGAPLDVEHRIRVGEETRWVRQRAELTFDAKGEAVRAVGTIQDVTERKRAEERRDQLEGQLLQAQKMESVGHLAGGIAHDFNNILAGMVMNLGLIRDDVQELPGVLELVTDLEKEAQRAAGLVRQLLLFARRQVMAIRRVELGALLDDRIRFLGRLAVGGIELVRDGPRDPAWIEADPGMIEHAIHHLVMNARESMPRGGRISLRLDRVVLDAMAAARNPQARVGGYVSLSVSDTGNGMDATTLRRIFEPFFTTKGVGQGTGLGLSAVYGIVRQHRGWVEVDSEVGKGSVFRVYLPVADASGSGAECDLDGQAGEKESTETGVVLVVDDEPAVCQAAVRVLERSGYRVLSAKDGISALDVAAREPGRIDVLLTDLVMPGGIGGVELGESLRRIRPGLRVMVMSGYGPDMGSAEPKLPSGAIFLQKPFAPDALLQGLRECMVDRNAKA